MPVVVLRLQWVSYPIMPMTKAGVRIDGVTKGRPAEKAGVQAGDVIMKLGENSTTDIQEYMKALGKFEKGQTIDAEVKRGAEKLILKITF
ncbi:MAG: PDZ domain-containing protein [Emticicia sp.]|nr:PDZ domain-containing protein [Emticicia sp.]